MPRAEPTGRLHLDLQLCGDCAPSTVDSQVVGVHCMRHVCADHVGLGYGFFKGCQVLG